MQQAHAAGRVDAGLAPRISKRGFWNRHPRTRWILPSLRPDVSAWRRGGTTRSMRFPDMFCASSWHCDGGASRCLAAADHHQELTHRIVCGVMCRILAVRGWSSRGSTNQPMRRRSG